MGRRFEKNRKRGKSLWAFIAIFIRDIRHSNAKIKGITRAELCQCLLAAWLPFPTFIADIFESLGEEVVVISSDPYCSKFNLK